MRKSIALGLAALTATSLACQAVTGLFASPTPTQPPSTATPVPPPDLTGTHWFIYYNEPGGTYYEYEVILYPRGRMENFHPNESTPNNDTWMQRGDVLILLFNDAYATYEGRVVGETISGTATNVTGASWPWEGYRLP